MRDGAAAEQAAPARPLDRLLTVMLLVVLGAAAVVLTPTAVDPRGDGFDFWAPPRLLVPALPLVVVLVAEPIAVWLLMTGRRALPAALIAAAAVAALLLTRTVGWTVPWSG